MKKIGLISLLPLIFLLPILGFSQDQDAYKSLIKEAEAHYEAKTYQKSGETYAKAFVALGGKGYITDRYNAACSWALAGQSDSAFVQLIKISKGGYYTNYGHLTSDSDLNSLYEDPRWKEVLEERFMF